MRRYIALLCCLFVLTATAQQSFTKVRTGKIRVLNFSSDAEMRQWFLPEYRAYEPNDTLLKKINNYLTGKQLVLVLGTWCSDSQREVPRWMKVLNRAGYDVEYMKIVGVGRNKKTPLHIANKYRITNVPTLIVYQDGKEVKRITESPKVSFEHDLLN